MVCVTLRHAFAATPSTQPLLTAAHSQVLFASTSQPPSWDVRGMLEMLPISTGVRDGSLQQVRMHAL